jgi:hypothetical protein
MAGLGTPSERRDDRATDRDAVADRRDGDSRYRDDAAGRRDSGALSRDDRSADRLEALEERLVRLRRHVLAGLLRVEVDVDPLNWPDLGPAALIRLRAQVVEQGRLAALEDRALLGLLEDLGDEFRRAVEDRAVSAGDRESSAADRHASNRDRRAAAADRVASAGDRDQAAIERELVGPADREATDPEDSTAVVDESVLGRTTRAVQDSRRRIIDSRTQLGATRGRTGGAPAAPDSADLTSHSD